MICVSLGETTPDEIRIAAEKYPLVEVRLDKNEFTDDQVEDIFSRSGNLIATFRPGKCEDEKREDQLKRAVKNGAAYVDIGYENPSGFFNEILNFSRDIGCRIITSYHNFIETPGLKFLKKIKDDILNQGSDLAKIACMINSNKDIINILSLLEPGGKTVAIGMGEMGKITRVAGALMGSPLVYTSETGRPTAEGQVDIVTIKQILELLGKGSVFSGGIL